MPPFHILNQTKQAHGQKGSSLSLLCVCVGGAWVCVCVSHHPPLWAWTELKVKGKEVNEEKEHLSFSDFWLWLKVTSDFTVLLPWNIIHKQ